mmetsp:Transcript_33808/g.81351  ORF Transcript_33808/g.81351 Transcript_33808/m.81351 type:complete len:217 (+) Transcript_33808:205-855(+)
MKLFLVCLAALIAVAFGQDLPAAGNVRKSRRVQYSGGYKDGIKVPTNSITFFLSYKPVGVYSSLTDPFSLTSVGGQPLRTPLNNSTFIFTILGQATSYTPQVSTSQPVNSNILGAPTFREVQIVAAPGYAQQVLIEFAVQGCFDQLTLTLDGSTNVVGALCYQGFVTGLQGLLVITGGSGDFTGATGTIYQSVETSTVMNAQVPSLVTLYFVLNLA